MLPIIIGSTSSHKKDATRKGCVIAMFDAEVFGVATESGQDAQPVGYAATRAGAYARALQAQERDRKAIGIGIESGLVLEDGVWYDVAIVILLVPGRTEPIEVVSEKFKIPEQYVEYIREADHRGFATTTLGDILNERFGCDPTDLEAFFSDGRTGRADLMAPAIAEVLGQLDEA